MAESLHSTWQLRSWGVVIKENGLWRTPGTSQSRGNTQGTSLVVQWPRLHAPNGGWPRFDPWSGNQVLGFPCGSAGKESTFSEGDLGSIPGLGRSPGEGKGYQLQYSGLENSMDCIVLGVAKSRTRGSDFRFHFLSSSESFLCPVQSVNEPIKGTLHFCYSVSENQIPHAAVKTEDPNCHN